MLPVDIEHQPSITRQRDGLAKQEEAPTLSSARQQRRALSSSGLHMMAAAAEGRQAQAANQAREFNDVSCSS
jgi:hypothetical protein